MAYSNKVVDKFEKTLKDPKAASVGRWKPGDKDFHRVGTGIVGAPACGDVMKLQIKCENIDGANKIVDAKFKTYGCGSAIASSSLLTEWVKGRTIQEATDIKNVEIAEELALPPVKIHCSVLAEDAIKAAIADYEGKNAEYNCECQEAS